MNKKFDWKIAAGILVSLFFMYFAFRKVDISQMGSAFAKANYWYLLPVVVILLFSHLLRAWRWKLLLTPLGNISMLNVYSALMIGYMANTFVPAHLGEIFRAYVVGRKSEISSSAVFATVVVERVLDMISLVVLLALTLVIYPFPDWVKKSGYISFVFIAVFVAVLVLLKVFKEPGLKLLKRILSIFPEKFSLTIYDLVKSFLDGIVPLKHWHHYFTIVVITVFMWACYAFIFNLSFYAFDFVNAYDVPWKASLALLVVTTISIAVPSSPGYVGTYHYLCQQGLSWFNVPESEALSFAFVAHGMNFIPVLILGFFFLSYEGLSFRNLQKKPDIPLTEKTD